MTVGAEITQIGRLVVAEVPVHMVDRERERRSEPAAVVVADGAAVRSSDLVKRATQQVRFRAIRPRRTLDQNLLSSESAMVRAVPMADEV
jgi:hypothetical protein